LTILDIKADNIGVLDLGCGEKRFLVADLNVCLFGRAIRSNGFVGNLNNSLLRKVQQTGQIIYDIEESLFQLSITVL
jgi:hypothetical protein